MTIVEKVFAVFTEVGGWFAETLPTLTALFYNEGDLTIIGVMTIASVGISVALLLFNYVKDLMRLR